MTSRRRGSLQLLREYLEEVASEGGLSAYDEAAARAWVRVGEKPGELFALLKQLQSLKDEIGCDLSALVVSRTSGLPGPGWGSSSDWRDEVARCYEVFGKAAEGDAAEQPGPEPVPAAAEAECSLRYTPGNAGDLLKHNWLAAIAAWLSRHSEGTFECADPFAGQWDYDLLPAVEDRLSPFPGSPLSVYSWMHWQQGRYLGSTGLVSAVLDHGHRDGIIWVGDECQSRVDALVSEHGCSALPDSGNGYAVLESTKPYDLILLDPSAGFLERSPQLLPQVFQRASSSSLLLFVLSKSRCSDAYREYRRCLRDGCDTSGLTCMLSGITPAADSPVKGETYYSEAVFLPRTGLAAAAADELLPILLVSSTRVAAATDPGGEAYSAVIAPPLTGG